MPAPTPTLTPIAFDAGQDWKLVEANGRDESSLTHFYGRITIKQRVVDSGETPIVPFWVVSNGEGSALQRPEAPGAPIAFCYPERHGQRHDSPEEALALLVEYLEQPINPYVWAREGED
jgi:hypothetical protein